MPQLSVKKKRLQTKSGLLIYIYIGGNSIFRALLGSVYLRVTFNLLHTLLGSLYLRVIFNLLHTLLGSVYLRVIFNLFYTLLGSVYLRVVSIVPIPSWVVYTWGLFLIYSIPSWVVYTWGLFLISSIPSRVVHTWGLLLISSMPSRVVYTWEFFLRAKVNMHQTNSGKSPKLYFKFVRWMLTSSLNLFYTLSGNIYLYLSVVFNLFFTLLTRQTRETIFIRVNLFTMT